jgi:hypothetical protein
MRFDRLILWVVFALTTMTTTVDALRRPPPLPGRVAAAAKDLNVAVGRGSKWRTTSEEVLGVIRALPDDIAAAAILHGNVNKKTAVHFVAQMRPDDGGLLLSALLERCPDPTAAANLATSRGHTPLIYACGRGNDAAVLELLRRGANPRVITVTGDSALSMARGGTQTDPHDALGPFDGEEEGDGGADEEESGEEEGDSEVQQGRRKEAGRTRTLPRLRPDTLAVLEAAEASYTPPPPARPLRMPAPLQPSEGGVIGAGLSVEAKPASVAAAAAAGNGGGGGGAGSPDNGGWVDFRRDAEAIAAQERHVRTCPDCRRKLAATREARAAAAEAEARRGAALAATAAAAEATTRRGLGLPPLLRGRELNEEGHHGGERHHDGHSAYEQQEEDESEEDEEDRDAAASAALVAAALDSAPPAGSCPVDDAGAGVGVGGSSSSSSKDFARRAAEHRQAAEDGIAAAIAAALASGSCKRRPHFLRHPRPERRAQRSREAEKQRSRAPS